MSDWEQYDVEGLLPEEKAYSVVKLDFFKHPADEDAAVRMFEVDDPAEAQDSTPDMPGTGWLIYDSEGNAEQI